jgi:iron complex outermembrane receptor protein
LNATARAFARPTFIQSGNPNMTFKHYAGLCPLAALLAANPAHAEAEDAAATIIVTARTEADAAAQRARSTPGGTDIVRHEDYADKSLVSLRDTLAFSPGVYLQPRYGQEVRISIRGSGLSRGFHMRGLTLLQDGIPINLADDNGDFQELEPIFFDHLEVYRGANALRFGSGTLGGAVNGVTPTGRTAGGLYLRADAGSFETARALAAFGTAGPVADGWAAISADTSNGDRDHASRQSVRFHGNIGLRLGETLQTRFYASVNRIDQEIPGALTLAQVRSTPKRANAASLAGDNARDIDSLRLQNRTELAIGDGSLTLGLFLNAKSLYHPIFQVVDQESTDRGFFGRFDYEGTRFGVTFGGESRYGDTAAKRFANIAGRRGALTFMAEQDARTSSLFGEVRFRPLDPLTLVAGGIYADGFRRQHERFNSFAGGPRSIVARARFEQFSPKFGLLVDVTGDIQLFGNYSRSAEFPTFVELAQISSFVPLKAQTAWTIEAGTRGRAGIARWDIAFYRADLRNEMLQFTVGPDIPASTFNARKTRHDGIEAALSLDVSRWLRLRQVYLYSDFRFRKDPEFGGNRLPVVPTHVYRADLRIGGDSLHLTPNLEWLPKGPWSDYRNSVRTSGYVLLGLTAGATIRQGIDLFFDARNLSGRKAAGDVSAVIAATPASAIYYPVERRAVFGGVRARF